MSMSGAARRRALGFGLAGVALAGLGGCIRLLPDPGKPPAVVSLRADPGLVRAAAPAPFSVGIGLPVLPAALAGSQVAAVREDGSYAFVEGVRLASVAPLSIQNVVLETFDRLGNTRAAVRAVTIARPDYELHFDVAAFDVTLPPGGRRPGVARIQATARLVEVMTGKPIASTVLAADAPAARGRPTEAARGLEAATRAMALEANRWVLATAGAAHASRAASATR
jgi:ABC-type uncharacterized transport system auxiliary subunit